MHFLARLYCASTCCSGARVWGIFKYFQVKVRKPCNFSQIRVSVDLQSQTGYLFLGPINCINQIGQAEYNQLNLSLSKDVEETVSNVLM